MIIQRLRSTMRERDAGFTIIELVAAMAVFALAAGSVVSVLIAGISAAGFGRDRTVGKDLARQQLEEMRRLPFAVSYATFPRKVDLLDNYFPNVTPPTDPNSTGTTGNGYYSAGLRTGGPWYRVNINPVPNFSRYRMEIYTRFLNPDLSVHTPVSTYQYNNAANDTPPTRLMEVEVFSFWRTGNRQNQFKVQSQIGEAVAADIIWQSTVAGSLIEVNTGFSDGSQLLAVAGRGTSTIHESNVTLAGSDTNAGFARITQPTGAIAEMSPVVGLTASAPADQTLANSPLSAEVTLTHPTLGIPVVRLGRSTIQNVRAIVTASPPNSRGELRIRDTTSTSDLGFSVNNQVTSGCVYKCFDTSKEFFKLYRLATAGATGRFGTQCAVTTTSPRQVTCEGSDSSDNTINLVRIFPANFSGLDPSIPAIANNDGYLVKVEFRRVFVRARAAHPGGGGTAAATAEFDGNVYLYTWNGSAWAEDKRDIDHGQTNSLPNPTTTCVIFDSTGTICKVFLSSYISTWSALSIGETSVTNGGRNARSSLNGVIKITTTPTNPAVETSGLIIKLLNITAESVDNR